MILAIRSFLKSLRNLAKKVLWTTLATVFVLLVAILIRRFGAGQLLLSVILSAGVTFLYWLFYVGAPGECEHAPMRWLFFFVSCVAIKLTMGGDALLMVTLAMLLPGGVIVGFWEDNFKWSLRTSAWAATVTLALCMFGGARFVKLMIDETRAENAKYEHCKPDMSYSCICENGMLGDQFCSKDGYPSLCHCHSNFR